MHARTAAQLYDGEAHWEAIAELKRAVSTIPVLGNGDIWECFDALRMMRETGCDGVVIGRGCLGRPWLFRELAEVFEGREPPAPPHLGEVAEVMREHAELLVGWVQEQHALQMFRKHATWYTKGFPGSARLRSKLTLVRTLAELEEVLAEFDPDEPFPATALRVPRGKSGGRQRVVLPEGYLDELEDDRPPCAEAEDPASGG
jgi:tRNA-dihydrouridine synthase